MLVCLLTMSEAGENGGDEQGLKTSNESSSRFPINDPPTNVNNDLMGRLQAFLPKIQAANAGMCTHYAFMLYYVWLFWLLFECMALHQ